MVWWEFEGAYEKSEFVFSHHLSIYYSSPCWYIIKFVKFYSPMPIAITVLFTKCFIPFIFSYMYFLLILSSYIMFVVNLFYALRLLSFKFPLRLNCTLAPPPSLAVDALKNQVYKNPSPQNLNPASRMPPFQTFALKNIMMCVSVFTWDYCKRYNVDVLLFLFSI